MIFSKVKNHFKTIKTNAIVNKLKEDTQALIKKSFATITKQDVSHCIEHSLSVLRL
jgi:plasmid replication initiation protein